MKALCLYAQAGNSSTRTERSEVGGRKDSICPRQEKLIPQEERRANGCFLPPAPELRGQLFEGQFSSSLAQDLTPDLMLGGCSAVAVDQQAMSSVGWAMGAPRWKGGKALSAVGGGGTLGEAHFMPSEGQSQEFITEGSE